MPLRRLFGGSPWLTDDEVRVRRQAAWAKLGKVNKALKQWDAYERAQADRSAPRVQRPTLSRPGLESLRTMLLDHLIEVDRLLSIEHPVGRVDERA